MYEKFTDRARRVMQLANQNAIRFNHGYIGTEHILLGLIAEGCGVGANVLKNFGLSLPQIRLEVEKLVVSGPDMATTGKMPQTPRAKKVIEYAMEEARNLNHNYVGTEHILLGLIREGESTAAHVLKNLGVELEAARQETLNLLGVGKKKESTSEAADASKTILTAPERVCIDCLAGAMREVLQENYTAAQRQIDSAVAAIRHIASMAANEGK